MSLARWGCDGSDVYVYEDVSGGITCCCDDSGRNLQAPAMLAHLKRHKAEGLSVADHTIESVEEIIRNFPEDGARDHYWKQMLIKSERAGKAMG